MVERTDPQKLKDAEDKQLLAQRQFKSNRQAAIDDALSSGRAKNQIEAENRSNWSDDYKQKVGDSSVAYADSNKEINAARKTIADNLSGSENMDPILYRKKLEAEGLNPEEIDKAIYQQGPEKQKQELLQKNTEAIKKQHIANIDNLTKQQADNTTKHTENTGKIAKLDPIKDAEEIKILQDQNTKLSGENQVLDSNIANEQKSAENSKTEAINQLKKDPANVKDTEDSTKLSNTGFEGINNSAPFYMQFPTLKSITDFRLRNGFSPYGEQSPDEIARDAVNFRIFETVPGVARAQNIPGTRLVKNIMDGFGVQSVGSFTIYPSDPNWISQSHQHEYTRGPDDILASTLNTIGGLYENLDSILRVGAAGIQAVNAGSLAGSKSTGNVYQRKATALNKYERSEPQTMQIKFNLFTKNDFLSDVFRPIMFLTSLGYPKRAMSGDTAEFMAEIRKQSSDFINGLETNNPLISHILKGIQNTGIGTGAQNAANYLNNLEQNLASIGGIGPYRYFISKRPEFLSMRHVSGLFYFPLANIINFSYNFKGPWYNSNGEPLNGDGKDLDSLLSSKIKNFSPDPTKPFNERVGQIFDNFGKEISETFNPSPAGNQTRPKGSDGGLLYRADLDAKQSRNKHRAYYAYPSMAECSLTIENSVPFFRDDYMELYYASKTSPGELVNVTQKNTGDEVFFANTSAKQALQQTERFRKN